MTFGNRPKTRDIFTGTPNHLKGVTMKVTYLPHILFLFLFLTPHYMSVAISAHHEIEYFSAIIFTGNKTVCLMVGLRIY